eukprot:m.42412 g.42412  ORF g.42412 m.42412 type:complete len:642 (+) comp10688_c0_seq1:180-2105(+)
MPRRGQVGVTLDGVDTVTPSESVVDVGTVIPETSNRAEYTIDEVSERAEHEANPGATTGAEGSVDSDPATGVRTNPLYQPQPQPQPQRIGRSHQNALLRNILPAITRLRDVDGVLPASFDIYQDVSSSTHGGHRGSGSGQGGEDRALEDLDDDGQGEEHKAEEEDLVSGEELFFDLVFVAVCIKIADFVKLDTSALAIWDAMLLLSILWLNWYHCNMIFNRFTLNRLKALIMYAIILGSMFIGIHFSYNEDIIDRADVAGDFGFAIFINILVTRVTFGLIYAFIYRSETDVQKLSLFYGLHFSFSVLLSIGGAVIAWKGARGGREALAWLALLFEILMYSTEIIFLPSTERIAIRPHHILERNHLWVILVLGESIISLVTTSHDGNSSEWRYYATVLCGFTLVYFLFQVHMTAALFRPHPVHFDATKREAKHARATATWQQRLFRQGLPRFLMNLALFFVSVGLLGIGISLKLVLSYASGDQYKPRYAWFMAVSLSIFFAAITLGRLVIRWESRLHGVVHLKAIAGFGTSIILHVFGSGCFLLFPLLHAYAATEYRTPTLFLGLCTLWTAVMLVCERLFLTGVSGLLHTLWHAVRCCSKQHHEKGTGMNKLRRVFRTTTAKDAFEAGLSRRTNTASLDEFA